MEFFEDLGWNVVLIFLGIEKILKNIFFNIERYALFMQ